MRASTLVTFCTLDRAKKITGRSSSAIWRGVRARRIRVLPIRGETLLVLKDVDRWKREPRKAPQYRPWNAVEIARIVKTIKEHEAKERQEKRNASAH